MFKKILIPTDGSDLANKAIDHAIQLAKLTGGSLIAMTAQPTLEDFVAEGVAITVSDEDRQNFTKAMAHNLDLAKAKSEAAGVSITSVQMESGEPWRAIIDTAKDQGADLIVMSSHGRRGLTALLLGSETQKVLTHSAIPVLVVR